MSARRGGGPLAPIALALGGELYDGGWRALAPGPGHGPGDRSLSLLASNGRLVVHSFAGDDWREVVEALRRRGLVGPAGELRSAETGGETSGMFAPPPRLARLAVARDLWAQGRDLAGTLAERHARRRGVERALPAALRFHPAAPAAVYRGAGPPRPALLARIDDPDGRLCGVELTYLAPSGDRAALRVPRKTIGFRPPGAAVRLDPAGETLVVGEGVFSCLSASEALEAPAWALLAVDNLRRWSPPAGVRRVFVAGDRGAVGECAAEALADRLRGLGVRALVRLPPVGCADWNDARRETCPWLA